MGPPRWQRVSARVGVYLCVLLFALWLGTLRYTLLLLPTSNCIVAIYGGGVGASFWRHGFGNREMLVSGGVHMEWLPRFGSTKPALQNQMFATTFIPFWIPFLIIAVPTALIIRRMRRWEPEGNPCQTCGYDLTGNVSGICPECGHGYRSG